MNQRAMAWAENLSRTRVSPLEREILKARAANAGPDGVSFMSNHKLATQLETERESIVRCNRSLLKKGLMVRATIPQFKTETRWYYLAVDVTNIGIFKACTEDKKPHPNSVVLLGTKWLPYPDQRIKTGLKTSSAKRGIGVGNNLTGQERIETEGKMPIIRTKNPPKAPLGSAGPSAGLFQIFWSAFPPSQRKRDKQQVRAFFMRLRVGRTWFEEKWLPAIRNCCYRKDGVLIEEKYQTAPLNFLTERRWLDES